MSAPHRSGPVPGSSPRRLRAQQPLRAQRRVPRRDRRGRGIRGPLLPPEAPGHLSRSAQFDELVLDAVERLERRWRDHLEDVEFAVEDVPPSDPAPWERGEVPLGRLFPGDAGLLTRIVLYRRPIETRADDAVELAQLVHEVVVEQVAHLLGLEPEDVDPRHQG